jgi:hypothetical protein
VRALRQRAELNEAHVSDAQRNMPLRDPVTPCGNDGCGGQAARAKLLTGIDGVSGRPVRKIILLAGD